MPVPHRLRRTLRVALLGAAIVASTWAAGAYNARRVEREQAAQLAAALRLHADALQRLVDRYRVLPAVLALDPQLRDALRRPLSGDEVAALNRRLERANGATQASTLTLIGADGIAVAANNWREASSNVGLDYNFRPYFQRAMRAGRGTFYAVGVSTNVPGYFIAEAVRDDAGAPLGVIVVKITLDALEADWARSEDAVLVSDIHDVVFLANRDAWRYRTLHALPRADLADLAATRQYADRALRGAGIRELQHFDDGAVHLRAEVPGTPRSMLAHTLALPEHGWTMHLLRDAAPLRAAWRNGALVALATWLPLVLLGLFLQQRARLARHRQRSREELERMVAHHTQALRSAQDSLVQAANQAALGRSASLEHLPQGVSVVDAELRLVAWNTRYQEIFRFPGELLAVGRPVEDLFRYNAQRGWFGAGDVEASIQRRLDHLRRGGPYITEREQPNGAVLEIRGNPLPGGGFVTSYADITSYRKAARDLRSLTATLERRIAERTRDLAAAKAEAEGANRYKARFVAAAVHDLLQPLNAARMYLGAIRERLPGADADLVERVARALEAQDALLGGMLEISRLESGTLRPQPRDVALRPLLQDLRAQFGIVAQARGLDLRLHASEVRVHSDPVLLRRVLQNFLSNALHYTVRGGVLVGCRRDGDGVRIEVWDTGIGIPESKREAVFQEFRRLDGAVERDGRSAGLGLSIVERIARLLGHPIGLRSRPRRGSVFWIRLPRAAAATSGEPAASGPAAGDPILSGRSVAVLDADPARAAAGAALLRGWGCIAGAVADGDGLRPLAAAPPPALLLLGAEFVDEPLALLDSLRAGWGRLPPVIVLAAAIDPALRARVEAAGHRLLPASPSPAALRALVTHLLVAHPRTD
ncbi:PAS-domain containing protein [Coralloluteibacterium stylophorae]|uniref:histidine kinase n=1 Tax=Coralloluteibacterium stylophorae TaxID=1776034 RepID=A0A8J8AWY1_9GAMM|nr:PAS-domain containing protein [Coralloluteibacterium stylophorae]MBS7458092.1 PAS-domain containing protein [Coralloluteibacterium stylophorae]